MNRLLYTHVATTAVVALTLGSPALAGPYGSYSDGISASNPAILSWAAAATDLTRGPMDIANPAGGAASFGTSAAALGPADAQFDPTLVVSLGDGGAITVQFASPVADTMGPDIAVFENSFVFGGAMFAELAFVEVSSNGVDFVRFEPVSLTQAATQLGAFDGVDSTDIHNLAGKNPAGLGTPFDLAELAGASPLLDTSAVTHVRIVDAVGSIDPAYRTLDSLGNAINDPYPTPFASSGFDLDAVAAVGAVPEPSALLLAAAAGAICLANLRRRVG